jgi:lipoate-protein ligase A
VEELTLRLLPQQEADGVLHMATDETMLASAAAGLASLRFYTWSRATLSLGYFQKAASRLDWGDLSQLPWVRRPSGGGAIIHDQELTYALALPAGPAWQPKGHRGSGFIAFMHEIIATAFAPFGINLTLAEGPRKHDSFLCFECVAHGDLLMGEDKVVGSAQRRHRAALLQHGSVLLQRSRYTPQLPGTNDLSGRTITPTQLAQAITVAVSKHTCWRLQTDRWSDAEAKTCRSLGMDRYSQPAWNARR